MSFFFPGNYFSSVWVCRNLLHLNQIDYLLTKRSPVTELLYYNFPFFPVWPLQDPPHWHLYQIPYMHKMVFCYQNCSDLLWEKFVLVIEKNFWNSRLNAENLQKFWDHYNNLLEQWKVRPIFEANAFLTCSWSFLRSNILEQL